MESLKVFNTKLENMNINELKQMFFKAKDTYYNNFINAPLELTDNEFDLLVEVLNVKDPSFNTGIVGALPINNKVELPYYLGSLNKIKENDEKKINSWKNTYNVYEYIMEEKLDGISGLLIYNFSNKTINLYTRGNGIIGSNISSLIPQINFIPDIILENITILAIRGELITQKKVFEESYKDIYSNTRSYVSAMVNSINPILNGSIDFIAYQILDPIYKNKKVSETLELLNDWKFQTTKYSVIQNELLTNNVLSIRLNQFKSSSLYEIDGLVVQPNSYIASLEKINPKHMFAFKKLYSEKIAQSKVIKVIWNITKYGYFKPKIEINPVNINGVVITFATAHNAKYILDNKIGPNTIIEITQSGDVIPYILKVISSTEPQMPDENYEWTESGVDIKIKDKSQEEKIFLKKYVEFFNVMDVLDFGERTIEKIMNMGYKSLFDILKMNLQDIYNIPGFHNEGIMAKKIYDSLQRSMKNRNVEDILVASNILGQGIGRERVKLILKNIPDILTLENNKELENKLLEIPLFGHKITKTILDNLEEAKIFVKQFYEIFPPEIIEYNEEIVENIKEENNIISELKDKIITFSNIRDKNLEKSIKERGGIVKNLMSKKTNILVVPNKEESESRKKVTEAKKWNIPIMIINDFVEKYII